MSELALPAELARRKVLSQDQWQIKEIWLEITKTVHGNKAKLSAELIPFSAKEACKVADLPEQLIPIRGNIFMIHRARLDCPFSVGPYFAAIEAALVHRTADAEDLMHIAGEVISNRYSGDKEASSPSMTVTFTDETFDTPTTDDQWFSHYLEIPQSAPAKFMNAWYAD